MPNSEGCVHSWPQCIYTVWQLLIGLGVEASVVGPCVRG